MNIILLSGGSGKRLWPLSNEIRSKQFLKVIKNVNGEIQSMLQRVFTQITQTDLSNNILIATSRVQYDSIKNQLSNRVSVVIEPERRDTFPAIALSCAYLALEQGHSLDEPVVVLPVDPYVDIEYFQTIKKLEKYVVEGTADIVLMGVQPTYPSEKYGYIIPEISDNEYRKVLEFKEKPTTIIAKQLIERDGLWNCGVFAFKLGYVLNILKNYMEYKTYDDVYQQYGKLQKTSFDYAVVEKAKAVGVVSYNGDWKDIGTWNTLTEVMENKPLGNVVIAETCKNTHVINELDIPVVVMGLSNTIVAASHDGILVSEKEQSSYLKKYTDHISQRPMFEEREWGEYKVLDMSVSKNGTKSLTKRKTINAGEKIQYQIHRNRSEVWTILSGECIVIINDKYEKACAGDTFAIKPCDKHGLEAITDVDLIEVQVGDELIDDGTEIVI